jgi:hypothetical protein
MAVIASANPHPLVQCCDHPVGQPVLTPVPCAGQNVISAPVATTNGQPLLSKMRSVSITQGQCATIDWQMHDKDGLPVDLSSCGIGAETPLFKVVLRLKEQLALGNSRPAQQADAIVVAAAEGRVQIPLTKNMVGVPGVYYAEVALIDIPAETVAQPCVIFSNTFYLVINRSTFDLTRQPGGPPSIAEIRLHLRDSSPSESYLLDRLMFDDAEIALAITRPVQYWNEIPPPLDRMYNTQSFPFRYHWLEGICANLFLMVAEQFRRNQFNYSAGGLVVDDQNKEAAYERAGQTRWQAYREWVRATKASINLESCYGEVTSNYKYSAYTDAIRIRY